MDRDAFSAIKTPWRQAFVVDIYDKNGETSTRRTHLNDSNVLPLRKLKIHANAKRVPLIPACSEFSRSCHQITSKECMQCSF